MQYECSNQYSSLYFIQKAVYHTLSRMKSNKDLHNTGDINIVKIKWVLGILFLETQTLM